MTLYNNSFTYFSWFLTVKDVPGGIPKSNLLGVTEARIDVTGQ